MKNIRKILLVALSFILVTLTAPFSVIGASKYKDYPCPKDCMDQVKKEGGKLFIYNWAEWWPEELFSNFSKEYNIDITFDYYADTMEMEAKFKLNPNTPYDLVLGAGPSNVMTMRGQRLIQKLNHDWLPNVTAYLMDDYKNRAFDIGNHYQIPDTGYITNFSYNSNFVDPNTPGINSYKFLFENEKYAGKITMLDNMYETIGAALKYLGYSYNSDNDAELMEAKEVLLKQKSRVMAYDSWPRRPLVEQEAWISQTWSGDAWLVSRDVKGLMSVVPEEGTMLSANTDFIPKGAKHVATAHLFLNYLFRTEANAMLVEWIGYPPVHKHVMELMSDEMKAWPGFILPEGYAEKCDTDELRSITGQGKALRVKIWQELKN